MAFSGIKTYFKARLLAVDPTLKEWMDGFNIDNIPHNIYDKAYHLSFGTFGGEELGAEHQGISIQFTVRLFFKGYRDVSTNIDRAVDLAENIIKEVSDPAERLGNPIKNVKFLEMTINDHFSSNDNLILVTQVYNVTQFLCLGG